MKIDLTNKTILVTGASRGIGAAAALQLAASGAKVLIHYNKAKEHAENLLAQIQGKGALIQCDLSKPVEVVGLIEKAWAEFGPISAVVNNAGIAKAAPDDMPSNEWLKIWEETMAVNTTSLGIICKEYVEHAKKEKQGRVINISSRAAFRGDTTDYIAYAASKGAVVSITRTIARHYGKDGIKAFLIAPGFTRTDMANEILAEYGEGFALNDIALRELTKPEDLAPMITLLCSGLADHATGASIDINAGSYVH
ncbi:SDR family NAD(P)-dependent oxidoreductase [Algoriphagus sediminis]|uniref:SDR family oxidoreductase n=1 Tax=Algoriphagus sediminis TaxID=3057113 RepID=A0ABT7YBS3_9BACT|nr:SDR family oxidoreductase [Algoriphagus sediminis]MDN3203964.1 SDR family oxidoreductase [Algoriphagus sediminis]